jgi:F420-non-reducing hydrogenase large subunit
MPGEEVPRLAAKICGICSSAYNVVAAEAIEKCWEVEPPEDAKKLRELMLLSNLLQSHTLHFAMLVMPDFVSRVPSEKNIVGLLAKDPELVHSSIRLRAIGQEITEMIGGRRIHAATIVPGGNTKPLGKEEISRIHSRLKEGNILLETLKDRAFRLAESNKSLFQRFGKIKSGFLCLKQRKHLTLMGEDLELVRTNGRVETITPESYSRSIKEHVVSYSFIKMPYLDDVGKDEIIRVGSLARINRAGWSNSQLKRFDGVFTRPSQSTFAYNIARVVELEECLKRMEIILNAGIGIHTKDAVKPKAGHGVGIVEAPRGILYHHYATDRDGIVTEATIIAPTTQNALAIEKSADAAAREHLAGKSYSEVTREDMDSIEMVVRAYDPCVSCSVHLAQINKEA